MELLITTQKFWFIHSKSEFFELPFKFKNTDYYISRHKLIENKKKSRLYALIWDYSFINFQQKVPPIRLFSPIFLLIFKEFSHLYFYSDPSSIRNTRVGCQKGKNYVHVDSPQNGFWRPPLIDWKFKCEKFHLSINFGFPVNQWQPPKSIFGGYQW